MPTCCTPLGHALSFVSLLLCSGIAKSDAIYFSVSIVFDASIASVVRPCKVELKRQNLQPFKLTQWSGNHNDIDF